jgi:hypothetical protein
MKLKIYIDLEVFFYFFMWKMIKDLIITNANSKKQIDS